MPVHRQVSQCAALLAVMLGAVACASNPAPRPAPPPAPSPAPPTASSEALNSPLRSLDLSRHDIPEVLLQALLEPYADPKPRDCSRLGAEIGALDSALGPDADLEPPSAERNDLGLRLVIGGVRSAIPYFGWVRRLSGAERREREVFAAREAGNIRRAYLKGLGQGLGCPEPASPRRGDAPAAPARVPSAPPGD